MIYSRFDIVWPDSLSSAEPRAGVDALTYGLATLVMREDLFENFRLENSTFCPVYCQSYACSHCGLVNYVNPDGNDNSRPRRSRRGNYFSQFVKKFSLGNGPVDWVQEYLVTKESGKMLGTLVALSIARMPNLVRSLLRLHTRHCSSLLNRYDVGILRLGHANRCLTRHMDSALFLRRSPAV